MSVAATGIVLKSRLEIERMRASGTLVHDVLAELGRQVRPGLATCELDAVARRKIAVAGAVPLFAGVTHRQAPAPFPACVCVSVNDEVVHGIPGDRVLRDGDIVTIDCGVRVGDACADAAATFAVGRVSSTAERLIEAANAALAAGLSAMRPWGRWRVVAAAMQATVERYGFECVRDFAGHGIGRELHEPPRAPGYDDGRVDGDFFLTPGLTLAIEPMVAAGDGRVRFADERRWTVVTCDGGWSAHAEHTVAVTDDGIEILTAGRPAAASDCEGLVQREGTQQREADL